MPDSLKSAKKDIAVNFRFTRAERRIYKKRKKIPVSDWAERHRYVTKGPLEGTRFKRVTFPYAADIMDASFYPSVEEVVMCTADQVGKSFIVDSCIAYAIDRDPGPVLVVYPNEATAAENVKERIIPMINNSPRLRSYLTGATHDETAKRVNLQHMQIYAAWANSAIQLANRSIKYLNLDEVDKYPATAGKAEAGPVDKAEKRLRVYRYGRKCWKSSTPTIEKGHIWLALNAAQVVFAYHARCPDCGGLQTMEFETEQRWFRWPEDIRDPERIENERLAYYVCQHCESEWKDAKRDAAVKWGEWRAMAKTPDGERTIDGAGMEIKAYLRKYKPRKIGFHLPSWISPVNSISTACAAFLKGQGDKNKLKDFNNSHAARPWKDFTQERKEDKILRLCDDRPRGIVPSGDVVSCLTAGVDTQDQGFWYEVRAWGWGLGLESWQIREGYVETFDGLREVLFDERYEDVAGNEYYIRLVVQDAMGHRTSEVYDFTRLHRGRIIAYKGEQRLTQPISWSNIEFYPGTKKPIPGGIKLLRADTTYFKNLLAGKLEIASTDPGAWHLHSETTEEWARHMCAEYTDEKGIWQCPDNRANHGWDCSVLNLVATEVLRVKFWTRPKEKPKTPPPEEKKGKGWIPRAGRRWLK